MVNLTQKERTLLEDEKKHEQLCVDKYTKYSNMASCNNLKNIFQQLGQHEQKHLDTINQILSGTVPNVQQGQQQQQQQAGQQQPQQASAQQNNAGATNKQQDAYFCNDTLSTEKFISGTYNTTIFEFKDPNIRNVLNHIQKEEQEHGKQIYDYMASHGMYQ